MEIIKTDFIKRFNCFWIAEYYVTPADLVEEFQLVMPYRCKCTCIVSANPVYPEGAIMNFGVTAEEALT